MPNNDDWMFAEVSYARTTVGLLQAYIKQLEAELEEIRDDCENLSRLFSSPALKVVGYEGGGSPPVKVKSCIGKSTINTGQAITLSQAFQDMRSLTEIIEIMFSGLPDELRLPIPPEAERATFGRRRTPDARSGHA